MSTDTIFHVFTGERDEDWEYVIPYDATHVSIHESVTVIPRGAFKWHTSIIQLICHPGVKRIEAEAFSGCTRLKYAIIPGVEVVEYGAFERCKALEYIDCDRLERIHEGAFEHCNSLVSINLPSAKFIDCDTFVECETLRHVKCSRMLEEIWSDAFVGCRSLEQITIPLKNGLFEHDDTFCWCQSFHQIHLVDFHEEFRVQGS